MQTQPLINELLKLRDSRPEYSGVIYDQDTFGSMAGQMIRTCIAGVALFSERRREGFLESMLVAKQNKSAEHSALCVKTARELLQLETGDWNYCGIFCGVGSAWPHELVEKYRRAEEGVCSHYQKINVAIEALSKMDAAGEFPSRPRSERSAFWTTTDIPRPDNVSVLDPWQAYTAVFHYVPWLPVTSAVTTEEPLRTVGDQIDIEIRRMNTLVAQRELERSLAVNVSERVGELVHA